MGRRQFLGAPPNSSIHDHYQFEQQFFTDTTAAMLIKHNNYTKLKTTENYNHLLEFTVVFGMNIKIKEFKQYSHKQMSYPDYHTMCGTLLVSTSFHPKSKSSFFIDAVQSLSINSDIHTEVFSFCTRISFFGGMHLDQLPCLWPSIHTNFGPPPMRLSV